MGVKLSKFTIWHLMLLMFFTATYMAVRTEFRLALILIPMCSGVYAAWSQHERYPSLLTRVRSATIPTVFLMLVFLIAELLLELGQILIAKGWNHQFAPFQILVTTSFNVALYTLIGLVCGVIVGMVVHFCAKAIDVISLGVSASSFQYHRRANKVLTCPICKTSDGASNIETT